MDKEDLIKSIEIIEKKLEFCKKPWYKEFTYYGELKCKSLESFKHRLEMDLNDIEMDEFKKSLEEKFKLLF